MRKIWPQKIVLELEDVGESLRLRFRRGGLDVVARGCTETVGLLCSLLLAAARARAGEDKEIIRSKFAKARARACEPNL